MCLEYVLEVIKTNPVEFLFGETKQMVVQFTEIGRNGLNWLRMTVKQEFCFGHGKLGTHKWKCQVSSCEPEVLRKVRHSYHVCVQIVPCTSRVKSVCVLKSITNTDLGTTGLEMELKSQERMRLQQTQGNHNFYSK